MSKPTSQKIPLTPTERAFVVDVLDTAAAEAGRIRSRYAMTRFTDKILANDDRAGALAAVVKAWPVDDGMVEIVLVDGDRQVVLSLLERPMVRADGDLFKSDDHTFTRGGVTLTGKEVGRLRRMFRDYDVDVITARAILLGSPEWQKFFGNFLRAARGEGPVMHAYLRNVAVAGLYIDDQRANVAYHVNVDTMRKACAVWENAGVCKLTREPGGGRRKYDRVYIEWHADMWLPPEARRKPQPESIRLQDVDDKAIEEMVA